MMALPAWARSRRDAAMMPRYFRRDVRCRAARDDARGDVAAGHYAGGAGELSLVDGSRLGFRIGPSVPAAPKTTIFTSV